MTKTAAIRTALTRVLAKIRTAGFAAAGFYFICVAHLFGTAIASEGQVIVYLEEAEEISVASYLSVRSVFLGSGSDRIELKSNGPSDGFGFSEAPQFLLAEMKVPPGLYDSLHLEFAVKSSSDLHTGSAFKIEAGAISLQLDLEVEANSAVPIFLNILATDGTKEDSTISVQVSVVKKTIPPSGSLIFVSNEGSDNITMINRFSLDVVDIISAGSAPRGMAYDRRVHQLYIANSGENTVRVVDIAVKSVIRVIQLHHGDEPSRLALSPDGGTLYVLNTGTDCLSVFDLTGYSEIDRLIYGEGVASLTVNPLSGKVYIANRLSDNVAVYDPRDPASTESYAVSGSPTEIMISDDGGSLFCGLGDQRNITSIDLNTAGAGVISGLCNSVSGMAFDFSHQLIYAGLGQCREIAVIKPNISLAIDNVPLEAAPGLVTLDRERGVVLAVMPGRNSLAVVNITRRSVTGYINVGKNPFMALVGE